MEVHGFSSVFSWIVCVLFAFTSPLGVHAEGPLYGYGPGKGDQKASLGGTPTEVTFPFPLRFYGQSFEKGYVTIDGVFSFEPGFRYYPTVDWREGVPNLAIDQPFIAPFHYDGHIPVDPATYPGKIYYQLTERQDDVQSNILLSDLDDYLRRAVVGVRHFMSKFALVITWENVTTRECTDGVSCQSNTFQLALVADKEHTFAIFNYNKMDIPYDDHHLAGMNGGQRRGWTDVIPCDNICQKRHRAKQYQINSLLNSTGSDVQGRYIMRLDGDYIVRGGCVPDILTKASQAAAEVWPRQTGMFGGQILSVSGGCRPVGAKIYCRFARDNNFISEGVMESEFKGRCAVPILTTRGSPVALELSTDGQRWDHITHIAVVLPNRLPSPVQLTPEEIAPWLTTDPERLTIGWNASMLTSRSGNPAVDINLIGYREDGGTVEFKVLKNIAQNVQNNGRYTFQPATYACESDCERFEVGLLQVKLRDEFVDSRDTEYQAINYGAIPLGWYVNDAMTSAYGKQWPEAKCEAWSKKDKQSTSWLDQLLPCPCTLTQALADWGRWQPDVGCNMFTGSVCRYHLGAKHCVRSVHPSPDGAGNQCCYEQDGSLRYAADTFEGSTPDRSHTWGASPYKVARRVPSLSHWVDDVITFYYCCLWTDPAKGVTCKNYMDRRPTKDCVAYTPPGAAAVYGDPHITTFDGKDYYFGGAGDFWLLKSDLLNIQGKFEQVDRQVLQVDSGTQLKPTVLTSIVAWKSSGGDVITVSMAPPNSPDSRRLEVRVNDERRFFQEPGSLWQDLRGVSVVNNGPMAQNEEDKKHSNFTVLFDGGAGVQVAVRQGLLHVIVSLPPQSGQRPQTSGLLGKWDGDESNDFTAPDGSVVRADSSGQHIYQSFAKQWAVSEEDHKFHFYSKAENNQPYFFGSPTSDIEYRSDNTAPSQSDVSRICGTSKHCAVDYRLTLDEKIARASRQTEEVFRTLQESQKTIESCGLLDIPMAAKSNTNYSLGSQVIVSSCRPYNSALHGEVTTYTCTTDGPGARPYWDPEPDPTLCGYYEEEDPDSASDMSMIIGIAVAVVAVVIIASLVAVILYKRRKTGEPKKPVPAKRTKMGKAVKGEEEEVDEAFIKEKDRGPIVRMSKVSKSEPV